MKNWIDELEEEGLLDMKSDFKWLDEREAEMRSWKAVAERADKHKKYMKDLNKNNPEGKQAQDKKYSTSIKGLMTSLSIQIKATVKRKEMEAPKWIGDISMFKDWLAEDPNFKFHYNRWIESNYLTIFKPTIQRLDSTKTFHQSNMKVVSSKERKHEY